MSRITLQDLAYELNISVKDKQQAKKIKQIMEEAVKLEVPNKVDDEYGKHWGAIE